MGTLNENTNRIRGLIADISALPPDRYETGLAEGQSEADAIIQGTMSGEYYNDRITVVGRYSFFDKAAKSFNLPNVTEVKDNAFVSANFNYQTIRLPKARKIGQGAFAYCYGLTMLELTECETVIGDTFRGLWSLPRLDLPCLTSSIQANCFNACRVMETLVFGSDVVCSLSNTNAFNDTPILKGTGYIYVRAALLDEYKNATNWSTFADQFRAIEDYPEICGEVSE